MSGITFEQAMSIADSYIKLNLKQLCIEQIDMCNMTMQADQTIHYMMVVNCLAQVKPAHEAVVLTRSLISWHAMEHIAKGA